MNPFLKKVGNRFQTLSLVNGSRVYGEKIFFEGNKEWRDWNPYRSKLSAGLSSGLTDLGIERGNTVLYLGSAEGTTVSHVSDLVGGDGLVVSVDVSPQAMAVFLKLAEQRENIIPLLGDANSSVFMKENLPDFRADAIVQDIAQKNQADIFRKNVLAFGKKGCVCLFVLKARSVDFAKDPAHVLKTETKKLVDCMDIIQTLDIGRFEKDHYLVYGRKK